MENIQVLFTNLIISILTIIVTALTAQFSSFINTKIKDVKEKTNSEKVNKYINLALETIRKVVICLNQTTTEKLKNISSDGKIRKLTEEEIINLRELATQKVLNTLSTEVTEYLSTAYGDVEEWIQLHIENYVVEEKLSKNLKKKKEVGFIK